MSSAQEAMKTLTQQWYNAITTQLNLSRNQFQIVQGNISLGATSQQLWSLMDSIPPYSITHNWTPGGINTFSSQYGTLISRLKDPSFGQFQRDMGDYFTAWQTYLVANPPTDPTPQGLIKHFSGWAYANIPDPSTASTVISEYAAAMNGPIAQANEAYLAAGGQTGIKAYTQSIEDVDTAAVSAPSGSVTLDSETSSSDVSQTWAKGATFGFYDVFFGEGDASYEQTTTVVTDAGLDITIKFDHVATIPIVPLSQGTKVAGPTTYQPWYVPAALTVGYSNNNNDTWQIGSPDWNTFFGTNGTLPRVATSLIVVNGINITLTSKKAVSMSSQAEVKAAFEAGFFPFFGIDGKGGWSNSMIFNDNGTIVAHSTCSLGNPQILGILQSPITAFVSAPEILAMMRQSRSNLQGISAYPNAFEYGTEVRALSSPSVEATQAVFVAWTAAAQTGLLNSGYGQGAQDVIIQYVNNWATASAPGWANGSLHTLNYPMPPFNVDAVVNHAGGNSSVTITRFY
ncbi:MAG: hypothetical protein RI580_08915 [Halothece sp. Uz-M2-17]|nr:hypothetical protein [Halothece sp. Uz-M2-17]